MEKIASILQFILCVLALGCLTACIGIFAFSDHIVSVIGYIMPAFLFVLTGLLARIAYKEMRDEFRK